MHPILRRVLWSGWLAPVLLLMLVIGRGGRLAAGDLGFIVAAALIAGVVLTRVI
jgi:hypothetical protein